MANIWRRQPGRLRLNSFIKQRTGEQTPAVVLAFFEPVEQPPGRINKSTSVSYFGQELGINLWGA